MKAQDAEAAALQQVVTWGFTEEAAQRALLAERGNTQGQEDPALAVAWIEAEKEFGICASMNQGCPVALSNPFEILSVHLVKKGWVGFDRFSSFRVPGFELFRPSDLTKERLRIWLCLHLPEDIGQHFLIINFRHHHHIGPDRFYIFIYFYIYIYIHNP